ncbi:autotransporter outer membrane beta-barrel domain-containing protein [Comamonas sp. B-9]|uniref:autotransporter outer membrane beta-barrel domain-containing protein n=1 Tax=Comamonas sp. B-9 TaxID=1055192 RepID=UPI00130DCB41|nr:autotransporter outer membrane beta-barrel domain-containing protein [Comamonas sp. B-9]
MTKHKPTLISKSLMLVFSMTCAAQVQAAANLWVGPGQVTEDAAWFFGTVDAGGANVINSASPAASWNATSANQNLYTSHGFYVGYGPGAGGIFDITATADLQTMYLGIGSSADPDMPALTVNDPLFRVGDAGGAGTLTIDLSAPPVSASGGRLHSSTTGLGVGLGAGSSGFVDVLGAGKTAEQLGYNSPNGVLFGSPQQNTVFGQSGGEGQVKIEGAGLVFQTGDANYPTSPDPVKYFAVGDGPAGIGSVDILGNGKLASGNPVYGNAAEKGALLPFSFIGKDSGVGTVTVEPTVSGFANRANFYTGLAVGSSSGNGALTVLEGGKSLVTNGATYSGTEGYCQATDPTRYPLAPASLLISADNAATGLVRATGSGTQLLVAGKSGNDYYSTAVNLLQEHSIGKVQIGSGGTLVTAVDATVKVGVGRLYSNSPSGGGQYFTQTFQGGLGPINVAGTGNVVYGSESATAVAPGKIEASQILLQASTAQLRFNHTSSVNFNLPLLGNGQLVQQAGTTVISPSLAGLPALDPAVWAFDSQAPCVPAVATGYPVDQSGFTGGLDVRGGILQLPATNVLPALTSTKITGGTLAQGGTNQNLGAVTQTGGVLQLVGGSVPGATDTANASTWAGGGGTVQLDTVLAGDGSASDKLHIAGTISGTTLLQISNLGGAGAQTTGNGILVVQADSANPANSFALAAPVIVGGFQYQLKQVGNNWYLASIPYVGPPIAPAAVPAMSWLGLLGLGGLLAAFSSRLLRRRASDQG